MADKEKEYDKKSFVLYKDSRVMINRLDDIQRGRLLLAIFNYACDKISPCFDDDPVLAMCFDVIKGYMDRDEEKYAAVCKKRREYGRKGGKAKADKSKQTLANASISKQTLANASISKQELASVADNDNDNENDNENDNDTKDLIVSKETICPASHDRVSHAAMKNIISVWNKLTVRGIAPVRSIQPETQRYKMLSARIRQYGEKEILKAIDEVSQSDFLAGYNERSWMITFDWFLKPGNFQKVIEGTYRNKNQQTKPATNTNEWLDLVDQYGREESDNEQTGNGEAFNGYQ